MLNSNNPILRPGYLINAEDISKALHNIYQTGDLKVFNSVFYPIVDPFKFTPTYFQDVKDQYSSIDVNNLHDYNDIFNNINSGQNNIFIFNNSNRPGEHWFSIVVKKVGNEYIISYLNSLITENLVPEHIDTVKEICKKAHLASGGVERSGDDLFIIYSPNKLGQGENKVCGAVSTINAILIARDISIKDPDLVYYTEKSIQLLYSRIYFKLLESYEITPNELIGLMYHNPVMGIQNNLEHDIDINQFIIPQRLIQLQSIVQNVKETYLRDNPGDYLSDLALIQHHQNILDEENRLQAAQVADLSKSTLEANNAAFKDGSYFDIRKYMLDVSTKQYQFTLQLQQNAQAPVNNVVQPAPAPAPSAPELEDIIIVPEDMASSIVPSAPPLNDVQEAPPAPLAQPDENTNRSASEILPEQLKQHFPNLNNNINTSNRFSEPQLKPVSTVAPPKPQIQKPSANQGKSSGFGVLGTILFAAAIFITCAAIIAAGIYFTGFAAFTVATQAIIGAVSAAVSITVTAAVAGSKSNNPTHQPDLGEKPSPTLSRDHIDALNQLKQKQNSTPNISPNRSERGENTRKP